MTHWDKLRSLPLQIDSVSWEQRSLLTPGGFERVVTVLHLHGADATGLGEELAYNPYEHELFQPLIGSLPLTGSWTLESFSDHVAALDLFGGPAAEEGIYRQPWYRQWTFESAALDLALRQAGTSLPEHLDVELKPVRFCASMGLGSPPSTERLMEMRSRMPQAEWKLDVSREWTAELVQQIGALEGLAVVDIKAHYGVAEMDENVAPAELLTALVADLPDHVYLEDAPLSPAAVAALGEAGINRLSWDAPIHSWADVEALEHTPAAVNIKPSRLGSLRELFRVIHEANALGIPMYSGGQFELAIGRAQIQELASLFYPDTANDCAPVAYHQVSLGDELPASPLKPSTPSGFGGAFTSYLSD